MEVFLRPACPRGLTHPIVRRYAPSIRFVSSSPSSNKADTITPSITERTSHQRVKRASPLAVLPLSAVLRSYLIMTVSSNALLLKTSTGILQRMLRANTLFFDVDRNPIIRWLLKQTFYKQFCAGESEEEVRRSVANLKSIGFNGVILEYAREVLEEGAEMSAADIQVGINTWREGLLDTVKMVNAGDFIGLKWSGMGCEALRLLKENKPPSEAMLKAMTDLCDAAAVKGVMLLPAAEPQNAQAAVDAWTLQMAQKYNRSEALLYNTYQCYLKSTPATLTKHLVFAAEKDFTLGVKLVRGAYLHSEKRQLIWDTKEETDQTYNALAAALLHQKWGRPLEPKEEKSEFPRMNLVLATHNLASVQSARAIRSAQKSAGSPLVKLSYAQLTGMATDVSMFLICEEHGRENAEKCFNAITWGGLWDSMNYLLRRATENKDAMSRTNSTRDAMRSELLRRLKAVFGMS